MTNEYQTMIEYIKDTTENKEALDAVAPRKKRSSKKPLLFSLLNSFQSTSGILLLDIINNSIVKEQNQILL